jgi:Fe2+ or Zn2+ uptake regulation protein
MDSLVTFQSAAKAKNLRMTHQRSLVLQVLSESQEHLDAESIHDRVRLHQPRVSLATVYRTLALFKELGLVNEYKLGEDHRHFETVQETPHYHFTCLNCHKVIEFNAPQIAESILPSLENQGLQTTEIHLIISGYCADCQESSTRG